MVFGGWIGCTTELWSTSPYIVLYLVYGYGLSSKTPSHHYFPILIHIFFLYLCFAAEYYDNGHCHACHSTCETCKGPTEGDCLTCASPLLLQGDKCVSTCDERFYMEAGVCAKCLHTCTQCVSRMNCTGCAKGLQLQSGECRTTCAEGWVIKNARCHERRIGHLVSFLSLCEAVVPDEMEVKDDTVSKWKVEWKSEFKPF